MRAGCPLIGLVSPGFPGGDAVESDENLPQVNRHHALEEVWPLTLRGLFQSDSEAYRLPDAVMQPQTRKRVAGRKDLRF